MEQNFLPKFKKADIPHEELVPLEGLNPILLRHSKVFPYLIGDAAWALVPSSENLLAVDFLEKQSGYRFKVALAEEDLILELIQKFYETAQPEEPEDLEEDLREDVELLKDLASEAPIIRLVNQIIREAVENRATDIHFEPQKDGLRVRYRIDGVLHERSFYSKALKAPLISRLKLMAKLNIAEHRLPQDGRIKFRVGGEDLDIRISTIPTINGEGVVLRLLPKEADFLTLDRLGLEKDHFHLFLKLIKHPNGIILVTGPTGSGKTTTLYAALSLLNSPDKKIITIEDPVEYQISGISQIQVKPEIGLTFASCLRSILRHDPDIILVGEIRDLETAEISIQASLTGHLVFSTLHTNNAIGAIVRLNEMGVERYLIAASLIGVVAQRLVRVLCPHCAKEIYPPPPEFLSALKHLSEPLPQIRYFVPQGCEKCSYTGYFGRIGIYEIVPVSNKLRKLILNASDDDLQNFLKQEKIVTLFQDGLRKVAKGITSFEEVLRVARL